jgi:DNA-binding response OmpR family regulator
VWRIASNQGEHLQGSYQILLIEDDPAVARSLRDGLQREGYPTVWKDGGVAGLAYALDSQPHLILLDVRLPDGSGFDFCRRMRQNGLHQPIIILSVQSEEVDKVVGLEMGADDYVTKPFSLRELVSRIRAQLRRAYGEFSGGQSELLFAADLVIDQVSGKVTRDKCEIPLTPIEFRLLAYLARHPGQALTRNQIFEEVWGVSSDLDSERTINVHIRRLREKIELDPSRPALILTVPGIGYRLIK